MDVSTTVGYLKHVTLYACANKQGILLLQLTTTVCFGFWSGHSQISLLTSEANVTQRDAHLSPPSACQTRFSLSVCVAGRWGKEIPFISTPWQTAESKLSSVGTSWTLIVFSTGSHVFMHMPCHTSWPDFYWKIKQPDDFVSVTWDKSIFRCVHRFAADTLHCEPSVAHNSAWASKIGRILPPVNHNSSGK